MRLLNCFILSFALLPTIVVAEGACARFAGALELASKLRGLSIKEHTRCVEVGKPQFTALLSEGFLDEHPPQLLQAEESLLKTIGFISKNFAYADCISSSAASAVLAFYKPELKTVFVPNWTDTSDEILVHEAVHALQDQHFNLAGFRQDGSSSSDRYLASAAVAEGDAVYVQEQFRELRGYPIENIQSPITLPCELPNSLLRILDFPYDYGRYFFAFMDSQNRLHDRDSLFKQPPGATKQLLYPRHFQTTSTHPNTPTTNIKKKFENGQLKDTLGEFFIRALLESSISKEDAILAAKGWVSDSITFIAKGAQSSLEWKITWESPQDAAQFHKAWVQHLATFYQTNLHRDSPRILFQLSPKNSFTSIVKGSMTLFTADIQE
jgi:hypothetical protein